MTADAAKPDQPSDGSRSAPDETNEPDERELLAENGAPNEVAELRPNVASTALFICGTLAFVAAVAALVFAFARHQSSSAVDVAGRESAPVDLPVAAENIRLPPVDRTPVIHLDDSRWTERLAATAEIDFENPALEQFTRVEQQAAAPSTLEIPPERRWEFLFADKLTTGAYAAQLDALRIELGVIAGDQIEYASKLSEAKPVKRSGAVEDEHRMYLSWNRGDLDEADRTLLANAEINSAGKIVLHFCAEETIAKLAEMELAYKNQSASSILRTRFGVKPWRGSFQFTVLDQQIRN